MPQVWHRYLVQESLEPANKSENLNSDKGKQCLLFCSGLTVKILILNRMLDHSETSHNVAKRCDVKWLDKLQTSRQIAKKLLLKGGKFISDSL